jgi:hypothetical protein
MVIQNYFASLVVVAAAVGAGVLATSSASWAGPSQPHACGLWSGNVSERADSSLIGSGGRQDCGDKVDLAVAMYQDIALWPDTKIGSASKNDVVNDSLTIVSGCSGLWRSPFYILTDDSSGKESEGTHITLCG